MKTMRIAALAATLAGAAVGLAAPASADLTPGTYQFTVIESSFLKPGPVATWVATSCGTDCMQVNQTAPGAQEEVNLEFHRDGATWTAVHDMGSIPTKVTVDNGSLAGLSESQFEHTEFQLARP